MNFLPLVVFIWALSVDGWLCRRCFSSLQFKTERNNGPRVPDKKKQAQVNVCVQKINAQHPVSWSECMTCIEAEFPDPTETCKFLQSDAKRVPKSSVGKHCELVCQHSVL